MLPGGRRCYLRQVQAHARTPHQLATLWASLGRGCDEERLEHDGHPSSNLRNRAPSRLLVARRLRQRGQGGNGRNSS